MTLWHENLIYFGLLKLTQILKLEVNWSVFAIYIYYYAEAAITLYTNKLYTHTMHNYFAICKCNLFLIWMMIKGSCCTLAYVLHVLAAFLWHWEYPLYCIHYHSFWLLRGHHIWHLLFQQDCVTCFSLLLWLQLQVINLDSNFSEIFSWVHLLYMQFINWVSGVPGRHVARLCRLGAAKIFRGNSYWKVYSTNHCKLWAVPQFWELSMKQCCKQSKPKNFLVCTPIATFWGTLVANEVK